MWFRLALKMGRTVDELQRSMSSAEFGEWIAFYSIEPFGDRIADMRAGTIAAVTANASRAPDSDPYTPIHFVPWAQEPEPEATPLNDTKVAAAFGINLSELKKGGKPIIIRRGQSTRTN
ncbi:hypothetical protein DF152_17120 [Burkholderia cenocepacia]|nr:hypothetical protein DF152_17120 [Burkholderia cenocepacia]